MNEVNGEKFSYMILKKIGSGTFGDVYFAQNNETGNFVVIKQTKDLKYGERESSILFKIKGECTQYLICISDVIRTENTISIVLDYIPGVVDLKQVLWIERRDVSLWTRYNIAVNLVYGLHVLHRNDIIHRDIKSDNILCEEGGGIHYIDYGLSCAANPNALNKEDRRCIRNNCGSLHYMSPDLFTVSFSTTPIDTLIDVLKKADLFSLGCVLYELLLGSRLKGIPVRVISNPPLTRDDLKSFIDIVTRRLADIKASVVDKFMFILIKANFFDLDREYDMRRVIKNVGDTGLGYVQSRLSPEQTEKITINASQHELRNGFPKAIQKSLNSVDRVCIKDKGKYVEAKGSGSRSKHESNLYIKPASSGDEYIDAKGSRSSHSRSSHSSSSHSSSRQINRIDSTLSERRQRFGELKGDYVEMKD